MAPATMAWLNQLLSRDLRVASQPRPVDRKPMEIEVECLPDRLWRELGFMPARRPGKE